VAGRAVAAAGRLDDLAEVRVEIQAMIARAEAARGGGGP
jgi:hypothetical protein